MTKPPPNWEEQAVARYRQRLKNLKEQLGPHASFSEVEELLIEQENNLMKDTLEALTEGLSPPRNKKDT
jgi:hypothetical protein